MPKTYENLVFTREVGLAVENFFVAPYPTTFSPTRVDDVFAPPSGFTWLGATVEDTPGVTVTREKFQLQTGIPKVIQFEAITAVAGRVEAMLYSHSPRKVQYSMGNVDAHNLITDASSATDITSVTDNKIITLTSSPQEDWNVGDFIVTTTTAVGSLVLTQNEAQIASINGLTIAVGTPGFPTTPTASDTTVKVLGVKQPFGTNQIDTYAVLGVAEFADGVQVIHHFEKMAPAGEWTEQIRPDDVGKIPIAFDAYGLSNAEFGSSQLIVGKRYWFPATT